MFISIKVLSTVVLLVVSAVAQSDSDLKEAQRHYKIALVALDDKNLEIASEELNKAVSLAPSNALGHYYLALVQSQQNVPGPALTSLKQAMSLGLPRKESDLAEELLAKLQYQSKKAEVDAGRATPEKLIGLYRGEIESRENGKAEWKNESTNHQIRNTFVYSARTLSLKVVDGSHITGFIKIDIAHKYEFRCLHITDFHGSEFYGPHKDRVDNDNQEQYVFVDLSVNSDGSIEGISREVCYYAGNDCLASRGNDSGKAFKVSWDPKGNLLFRVNDSTRAYHKTGSIAGSVGTDIAYEVEELRPFR